MSRLENLGYYWLRLLIKKIDSFESLQLLLPGYTNSEKQMEVVMLRLIGKFFGVTKEKIVKEECGWEKAGGTYVASYKTVLDGFAQSLGDASKHRVVNRFDPDYNTAVIKSDDGIVLARVRVHGEMCRPYEAVVHTNLGEKYQIQLGECLKGIAVKFIPLYPW